MENKDIYKIDNLDFFQIKKYYEKKYGLKIFESNFSENLDTSNKGMIEIYKDYIFVGKIWGDLYSIDSDNIIDSHLGIYIDEKYRGEGYSKILFELYKIWSKENKNIFIPLTEYASINSRIVSLISNGYVLDSVWDKQNQNFSKLSDNQKNIIIKKAKENFNLKLKDIYSLKYQD